MESSISRTSQSSQRVVACSCGDVGGHLGGGGGARARSACRALAGGVLSCIAGSAFDKMYSVSVFNLDAGQCIWVLEHTARVYQALAVDGDVCIFWRGELGLEVGDCGGAGQGEDMLLVVCSLDVEGDLRVLGGGGGVLSHGKGSCVSGSGDGTGTGWQRIKRLGRGWVC